MLAGVGIGSLAWFVVLSCGVALARRHVGTRLVRTADAVAGAGLVALRRASSPTEPATE